MPSLTMAQFKHVLTMGLDSKNRRFAFESPATSFPRSNFGHDKRAAKLAQASTLMISALNRDEKTALTEIFYARNRFKIAIDFIVKFKSKEITPTALLSLYSIDNLMERRKRAVEIEKDPTFDSRPAFDATPSNIGLLDFMFAFDKKPHPRLWEKDSKKKVVLTA